MQTQVSLFAFGVALVGQTSQTNLVGLKIELFIEQTHAV